MPLVLDKQIQPIAIAEHKIVVASIAGKNNYTIPIGNLFFDQAGETTLDTDFGAGFIPQVYGVDYTHFRRSVASGTPPTVADAAIGFSVVGAVPAGWSFRFRWFERRLLTSPIAIAKINVSGNYSVEWTSNSANAPDGVLVPAAYPGTQIEFWRQTWKNGGLRGTSTVLFRQGKRYLPYFRGAIDVLSFPISAFCPTERTKRNHFRVCYYDPITGARSALSTDIIVVCSSSQADGVNGRIQRRVGSVWIE